MNAGSRWAGGGWSVADLDPPRIQGIGPPGWTNRASDASKNALARCNYGGRGRVRGRGASVPHRDRLQDVAPPWSLPFMLATISRQDRSQSWSFLAASFIASESNFSTSAAVSLHASARRRRSRPSAGCAWRSCTPTGRRTPRSRRPGGAPWRTPSCPGTAPCSSGGRSGRRPSRTSAHIFKQSSWTLSSSQQEASHFSSAAFADSADSPSAPAPSMPSISRRSIRVSPSWKRTCKSSAEPIVGPTYGPTRRSSRSLPRQGLGLQITGPTRRNGSTLGRRREAEVVGGVDASNPGPLVANPRA